MPLPSGWRPRDNADELTRWARLQDELFWQYEVDYLEGKQTRMAKLFRRHVRLAAALVVFDVTILLFELYWAVEALVRRDWVGTGVFGLLVLLVGYVTVKGMRSWGRAMADRDVELPALDARLEVARVKLTEARVANSV